jgi:hypothetical protein
LAQRSVMVDTRVGQIAERQLRKLGKRGRDVHLLRAHGLQ